MARWRLLLAVLFASISPAYHQVYVFRVSKDGNVVSEVSTSNPSKYFKTIEDENVLAKALYNPTYSETG